jgi:glucokinase
MYLVGLDLGGTKLAGGLLKEDGTVVHRRTKPLEKRSGSDVGAMVCDLAKELYALGERNGTRPHGIGISVPGIAHAMTGTVWAPNINGWDNYPLADEVSAALGERNRVIVESDRACSILGELWKGAAQGCTDAIFLAVGTGIGAGIVADGRILRGAQDIAGAIGWMALDRPFRDEYVPCGCFEYFASGEGLARVGDELLQREPAYRGVLREIPAGSLTSHDIFAAFESGDSIAQAVIDTAIGYWGMAAANLISLFNPDRLVFGGGVFGPAVRFLDAIRRESALWAQPISMKSVRFLASALGGDAAMIGAAYRVLGEGQPS